MAAKIGILGESTAVAIATATIYTVPASKAARIRLLFVCEADTGSPQVSFQLGAPGSEQHITMAGGSNVDFFSGIASGATQKAGDVAANQAALGSTLTDKGADKGAVVPFPHDYILSTGDTVKYKITNEALLDALVQVIGVEDDA